MSRAEHTGRTAPVTAPVTAPLTAPLTGADGGRLAC